MLSKLEKFELKNIKDIKDIKIIGLGEATHGQLKINEFRNRMIKDLIKNYNFNTIVLEEEYSCCKILDKYIKNKKVNFLDGELGFLFLNKTFLSLLNWLKKYNKKNNNKISILGVDVQGGCKKYKSKNSIYKFYKTLVKKLEKIDNIYKKNESTDNLWKLINLRDKCMYQMFNKLYNPKNKYMIIGHNGHLQKYKYSYSKAKWLGNYLYEKFKNKYCVIGNSFYTGEYIARDIDNKYKFNIAKIKLKKILNDGFYYVDKNINKKIIYEGGAFYSSKNPYKMFESRKINNNFDYLIIINNEKPFKLINNKKFFSLIN